MGDEMRKAVAILCSILLSVTVVSAEQSLALPIPTSFVDLKHSEPTAQSFANSEQHFAAAKRCDAYAVKLEDGQVVAKLAAKVFTGAAPASAREAEKAIEANGQLAGTKILSTSTIVINGAACLRLELERKVDGETSDQLVYDIPAGDHWASVVLDARQDKYPEEARNLDAFVRTIPGISPQHRIAPSDGRGAAELGGLLLMLGLGGWLGRKQKRKQKRRRRPLP